MYADVYQPCNDCAILTFTQGPLSPSFARVLRGGAAVDDVNGLRPTYRWRYVPTVRGNNAMGLGFRCARSP